MKHSVLFFVVTLCAVNFALMASSNSGPVPRPSGNTSSGPVSQSGTSASITHNGTFTRPARSASPGRAARAERAALPALPALPAVATAPARAVRTFTATSTISQNDANERARKAALASND